MKIKIISSVYLVGFILASCTQTTPIPPTKPPAPPVTSTIPVPSLTPSPTKILATPTETKPSNADFLAHTENSFPLAVDAERGFAHFIGTLDVTKPDYEVYTAPDGTTKILLNYPFRSGGVDFIVPAVWNGTDSFYFSLSEFANPSDGWQPDVEYITLMNGQILKNTKLSGTNAKVTLTLDTGSKNGTATFLGMSEPFVFLWANSDWDEAVQEFIRTGDWTVLPKINGKPLLPAVKIKGVY